MLTPGNPSEAAQAGRWPFLGPDRRRAGAERRLADFSVGWDTVRLTPLAVLIGALAAGVALGLLDLIGLCTNLLYFGRVSTALSSPSTHHWGLLAVLVPVGGGLVVGLMARFGSEAIRGHGIPEAMERILIGGSRVQPRLAVLKPISSAVSIGSGGPFGAEGPIILTGGAVGSIVGQLFRLTATQRKALLVAGAAAGMSAVFGTPVASALFGVELLAFELKPRTTVLVGLASATADGLRMVMASHHLVSPQPLFPVPDRPVGGVALLAAAGLGLVIGAGAWVVTRVLYAFEDVFGRLGGRLHWMWWPAIGGLAIGAGGLLQPRALGVGYGSIHSALLGQIGVATLVSLFAVKLVIWSVGLGSGTSGGIVAPVLIMGTALGGSLGHVLPGTSPGVWALVGMAALFGSVIGSPFTAVVFAFELTHDTSALPALLVAVSVSYLVGTITLRRSVVTEKVARRGFHVNREYGVDPLEATLVREVMVTDVFTFDADRTLSEVYEELPEGHPGRLQRLYPVTDGDRLIGVLPWSAILAGHGRDGLTAKEAMTTDAVSARPEELLRAVADRMVATGIGALPVVGEDERLVGLVSPFQLLAARQRNLEEERRAERVIFLRRSEAGGRRTDAGVVGPEGP